MGICTDICTKPGFPIKIKGSPIFRMLSFAFAIVIVMFLILEKASDLTDDDTRESGKKLWYSITMPILILLSFVLVFYGCFGLPNNYGRLISILLVLLLGLDKAIDFFQKDEKNKWLQMPEDLYTGIKNISRYLTFYLLVVLFKASY